CRMPVVTWSSPAASSFWLPQPGASWTLVTIANLGLSLGLGMLMFYLIYEYVPRRRVRRGAALGGAIIASLLWEVAKQLFSLYIRKVGIYDQIYSTLGVLLAFVMFVDHSASVFS